MTEEDSGGVKSEETQATEIKGVKSNHIQLRKTKTKITEQEPMWLEAEQNDRSPSWMAAAPASSRLLNGWSWSGPAASLGVCGGAGDQRQSRTWSNCCSSHGRLWEASGGKETALEPILLMLLHNWPNRSKKVKLQPPTSGCGFDPVVETLRTLEAPLDPSL